jgi:hypothetical protein
MKMKTKVMLVAAMAACLFTVAAIPAGASLTRAQIGVVIPTNIQIGVVMPTNVITSANPARARMENHPANSAAFTSQSAAESAENSSSSSGGGLAGTNLYINKILWTNAPNGKNICTLTVTNTVQFHLYLIQSAANVAGPYTSLGLYHLATDQSHTYQQKLTNSASRLFFRVKDTSFTLTEATTLGNGGESGGCPGLYAGQARFEKSGWGWGPDTDTTIHMIAIVGNTGAHVEIYGIPSYDDYCGLLSVSTVAANNPPSNAYRFYAYFAGQVPSYCTIIVSGFNP